MVAATKDSITCLEREEGSHLNFPNEWVKLRGYKEWSGEWGGTVNFSVYEKRMSLVIKIAS